MAGQAVALRLRVLEEGVVTEDSLYHLHADHLGSVGALTRASSGYVVGGSQATYEPFGAYRGAAPTTNPDLTDRAFTGQRENGALGLYYFNARYYVPGIGRFASADSLVPDPTNPQAFNRYSYVENRPLNLVDPTGHYVADASTGAYSCFGLECEWEAQTGGELSGTCGSDCGWVVGSNGVRQEYSLAEATAERQQGVRALGYAWTGASIAAGFVGADALFDGTEFLYCSLTGNVGCAALASSSFWIPGVSASVARRGADLLNGLCSFSEDTQVVTEEGLKPISEVELYDKVLAYDEETGEIGYFPIVAVWAHEDPVIVTLTIDGETIETTAEHPFYTVNGEWVAAGDLQIGDELREADWETGTVDAVSVTFKPEVMYNLTVAATHTYFVGDGRWLVHNDCRLGRALANTANGALRRLPERLRGITIAAAKNEDGSLTLAVYGKYDDQAIQALRDMGYNVLDVAPRGVEYHAERQLYDLGYTTIGISRQGGMCPTCSNNIPSDIVYPYRR